MQALLDTAPPPSSAPKPGETKDGARPKAAQALTPGRERFIPVSRYGLRAKLLAMLAASGGDRKTWQRALDCLAAWRHQEHRKRLLDLIEDYQPFSPDSDTANLIELDAKGRDTARREFIASMEMLLARANFVRLSRDDVQRLLIEQSPYGLNLKVDLSEFDEALLYYRGSGVTVREERNPWRLYLAKDRLEIPIFERLFLLLKLKPVDARIAEIMATSGADRARAARSLHRARAHLPLGVSSDHIYVKMFKRIPQIDIRDAVPQHQNCLQALRQAEACRHRGRRDGGRRGGDRHQAPRRHQSLHARARARRAFGRDLSPGDGLLQHAQPLHDAAGAESLFLQPRHFCSLANNRGALTLIADGAEEEDVKEDMLLFAFLAKSPSRRGALPEIKGSITSFLKESCGVAVNFDAEDALGRLLADGLVSADAQGNLTAVAPDQARAHLDRLWDRLLDVDTLDKEAAPAGE